MGIRIETVIPSGDADANKDFDILWVTETSSGYLEIIKERQSKEKKKRIWLKVIE